MNSINSFFDQLCQPNPKLYPDNLNREIVFRRNKGILFIELASLVSLIFYIVFANYKPNPVQQGSLVAIFSIITLFLICCRSYLHIFMIYYFLMVTLFGPIFHHLYEDSIFFNLIGTFLLATWLLCVTGSKTLFILQVIIQNLYLHFLYKDRLLTTLNGMTHEAFAHRMTNITTFGTMINAIFILTIEIALEKAYFRIGAAERQKVELERQKTFLLSFSHELRNLINGMTGSIKLSQMNLDTPKVVTFLRTAEVCGELLSHLVNNILDTGKVEIGELEITPIPNGIYETCEKVWGVCSQLIQNKGLRGQMRIEKSIPKALRFDNYRIIQIFLNLIGNAIKFTETGLITVDVQWLAGEKTVTDDLFKLHPFSDDYDDDEGVYEKNIACSLFSDDQLILNLDSKLIAKDRLVTKPNSGRGVLKIVVSDTGCGIPSDKFSLLFQKFMQVNAEPSRRKLGTGLGLFITKELTRRMEGDVKLFSTPGKGSVFIVCLPLDPIQENIEQTPTIAFTASRNSSPLLTRRRVLNYQH